MLKRHSMLCIRFFRPWHLIASVTLLLTCLPQKAAGVTWVTSLAEAKQTAAKKGFPIAIFWIDESEPEKLWGELSGRKANTGEGALASNFIWVHLDRKKDAETIIAIGVDAYFAFGKMRSNQVNHKASGYVFMNAEGDIYARLPGNATPWATHCVDNMLRAVGRRHYGPEKFYADSSATGKDSAVGRPEKMSGKVTTRKAPTKLHTWKTCDTCKAFLDKAMPYIASKYPSGHFAGMTGAWPSIAALTMYGKHDSLVKDKFPKIAAMYSKDAGGYMNWFRSGINMAMSEYALRYGLTPEIEKLMQGNHQAAAEYVDEVGSWFHHPRRGGGNYSLKQGMIACLFHASFVEMEFMGMEAEPGLSLSRASLGRFAYGGSGASGKLGMLVAGLYASGWADDPFTRFQAGPLLNNPRSILPGNGHAYGNWHWMGSAVGLHRLGPAEYAEWADKWVHPLITLQLEDGSVQQLQNDAHGKGGNDAMDYIKFVNEKHGKSGMWEATCVIASIVLMTEPGAFYGVPIKPKGSLPNKEAFSKGESAMRTSDHATAYANFAIVLPPGDDLELVYQARIHMRELQIKLCPDPAERRKRARKIASFSAEERAKGEIAIYAQAAKPSSAGRAGSNKAAMPKRTVKAEYATAFDEKLLTKIDALAGEGKLPATKLNVSISRSPLLIRGADSKTSMVKLGAGTVTKDFEFRSLSDTDRAVVAMAIAESDPTNQGLAALAAFMLECAGRSDMAKDYFERAGEENTKKVNALFEPLPTNETEP